LIREEVLSREAYALDLDERDQVIKRRLVQKLTFVLGDLAETLEPTEDELRDYLRQHEAKYRIPTTVSFTHIYFNPDRRSDAKADAENVLNRLHRGAITVDEALLLGDAIMLDSVYRQMTPQRVAGVLGPAFADTVFTLESQSWHGPVASPFGLHLIYIDERTESRAPDFAAIREQVQSDFSYTRKQKVVQEIYDAAKARYTILVEGLPYE
jgi:parvulin-like peptidyl-prolyl isomerase